MKIRELIVSLGFRADSAAVANFDNQVANLRARLAALVEQALYTTRATRGMGDAANEAARQFGPPTRWAVLTARFRELGDRAASAGEGFGRAGAALGEMSGRLGSVVGVALRATLAVSGLAAAGIANAVAVGRQSVEYERQAAALGVTVERYQALASVFGAFGVDASNMADFFNTIADRAQDATQGAAEAVEQFRLLGISARQLRGADPQEILGQLADGFSRATDTTRYLAAASRIFGDDLSRKVIPLLQAGRDGVEQYIASVRRFGGVLSRDQVRASARLQLSLARVGVQVDGLRKRMGAALAPALERVTARIGGWLDANSALLTSGIERWAGRLGWAFEQVADGVEAADRAIRHLGGYERLLGGLAAAVGLLGAGFIAFQVGGAAYAGAVALGEVLLAVAGLLGVGGALAGIPALALGLGVLGAAVTTFVYLIPPLTLLAGLVAGLALGLDELYVFLTGGDSILGRFVERFKGATGATGELARALDDARGLLWAVGDLLSTVGEAGLGAAGAGMRALRAGLDELVKLTPSLQPFADALDAIFVDGLGGVRGQIGSATSLIENLTAALRALITTGETAGTSAVVRQVLGFAGLGAAPIPAAAGASSRSSTYQGGNVTISGVGGIDLPGAVAAAGQLQDADRRAAARVLAGGDE